MRAISLRVVAALLILLGVGVGLFGYLQATAPEPVEVREPGEKESEPELERVVVAATELPAGRELSPGDLTVASRYRKDLSGLEGRHSSPSVLFGRKTVAPVPEGEVVTEDLLASAADGTPVGRSVSAGHKALALAIDEVEAAGGYLMPGDVVDLVWFVDHRDMPGPFSRTLVRRVKVLAFGERIEPGPESVAESSGEDSRDGEDPKQEETRLGDRFARGEQEQEQEEGEERQPRARSVVLEIADDKVSEVVLAARTGRIRLAVAGSVEPDVEPIASLPQEAEATALAKEAAGEESGGRNSTEDAEQRGSDDDDGDEDPDGRMLADLVDIEDKAEPAPPSAERQPPPPRVRVFSGSEASTVEVAR
ncbi:Flp pilus assembly protein CpaB [Guyparkeria sp.]|uniref:Flp pilus assembly protein CpaB n=1 Tax=Guyparkeria sp. TaxID=2035736 RepID=UPI003970620E